MLKRCLYHVLFFFIAIYSINAFGIPEDNSAQETHRFDWRAEAGAEIKVMANEHPWVDLIIPLIDEFEELTGISVDIDIYPEEQFRTKRTVELVSGISEYDIFMIMPGQVLDMYTQKGWLYPLNEFMESETWMWPDYDSDDIFSSSLNSARKNGMLYSIPVQLETSLLAYNKEILNMYGIEVPEMLSELEDACRKIYEESGGQIYGITLRGKNPSSTSQWVDFLHSFGGSWLDGKGNAAVDSPESIEATDYYGRLVRLYGPKTAPGNSWYESTSVFIQGKAAFIYDANVFKYIYEDSELSVVSGNVGYSVIPEGPAGSVPHVSSWGLAVSSDSSNREAAWLFIQWATSREIALRGLIAGIPSARESAWENPEFLFYDTTPEWTQASLESYRIATGFWNPSVIPVEDCRDIMGNAIVASILGENPEIACKEAAVKINLIIRKFTGVDSD